jgi:Domain of unknown function (DUF1707)/Domain of unknown function (DUF4190)
VIPSDEPFRAFASDGEQGKMRASDADRDRVVEHLSVAYSEGRLSKDEYDDRVANALSGRTYADLDLLMADLPAAQPVMVPAAADATAVAKVNGLAIASVACGVAQLAFGPLATLLTIVFGHMARQQIKRTGERGAGLALVGLVLGWGAVVAGIVLVAVALSMAAKVNGTMPVQPAPPPPPP